MEPPSKRPRLSMFSRDLPPDKTLTQARWRNDLSLKSRFEAIFDKYAHDFTGIADEIEVRTGAVVVNNGHLEGMEDEKDTGVAMPAFLTPPGRPGNISAGSLLRAIEATPEDRGRPFKDVQDDDLVMSIEIMAENAAAYSSTEEGEGVGEDDNDDVEYRCPKEPTHVVSHADMSIPPSRRMVHKYDNSEEDNPSDDEELFQMADKNPAERPSCEAGSFLNSPRTDSTKGWSRSAEHYERNWRDNDVDSYILIKQEKDDYWQKEQPLTRDRDKYRSSSPDSLFEAEEEPSGIRDQEVEHESLLPAYPELPSIDREVSDDAILDKFGPKIGLQVIDVLQKRRAMMDAHIEPAWRVPDIGVVFPRPKLETPPDDLHQSPEPSSGRKDSLWRDLQYSQPALNKLRYPTSRRLRRLSQLSNESEDPLQEDFKIVKDIDSVPKEENTKVSLDALMDGICPFCGKEFSVRGSVYVHWDELIKRSAPDDVHDMAYIRHQRRRKRCRSHFPKVTIQDFRTMIRLREVDNLDWQEIYGQGFFGQRPSTSIQSIYYQYRTLAKPDEELADEGRSWTAEEDEKLLAFCKDPTITFQKLRKLMRTRPQAELGNRLASIWLKECADQDIQVRSPQSKASPGPTSPKRGLPSSLEPNQAHWDSHDSDRLHRSWSSDSVDSLFQVDVGVEGDVQGDESDDRLFDAT